jgi:indoleacetamide hydrolase
MLKSRDLSRRTFVLGASAAVAMATTRRAFANAAADEATAGLLNLSAGEAVARMSRGEITVERYVSALLARCEALRSLNAFITLEPARVLEAARACDRKRRIGSKAGPLFGLPMPVKDSVNTRDYPTTGGTPALRHFRPAEDAPLVTTLKTHGAIVLGKTNLHELSFGWTSNNLAFGAVHNPYDTTRIPGGSSGGTAVAVATHMAPLGVGEDTRGSIRVPAAMCGISGLRPTTGRYPSQGVVPLTPLFDQVGPLARTVSDLALFDSVVTNDWQPLPPPSLKGVRLGISREYWFKDLDPEVERVTGLALERLKDAGVEIVEADFPGLQSLIDLTASKVILHDASRTLPRYLQKYGAKVTLDELINQASADVRDDFRNLVMPGAPNLVSEDSYIAARDMHLPALRRAYQEYFARTGISAIVFPVTMVPATPIDQDVEVDIRGQKIAFSNAMRRNISPSSCAGAPGLVLPAGLTTASLPVGIEFDAPARKDRRLLALGLSLERALGPIPAPNV